VDPEAVRRFMFGTTVNTPCEVESPVPWKDEQRLGPTRTAARSAVRAAERPDRVEGT